ncbi:MAG TPA: adenylosuccinate synthetase [Candidatus Saccharimonadales bacterium]|nr:adenylosuccinate synthetase [Candidatus Saccharimonadales bacterium]
MSGNVTAVVGLQYGDEGKGKIVDYLAEKSDVVIRANGGANAGHTIVLKNGKTLALHQIPSGVAYDSTQNIIGNGSFIDPVKLVEEMEDARSKGLDIKPDNFQISKTAHLVLPVHKQKDAERESGEKSQGSTKAGIAFAAADKSLREGIRVETIAESTKDDLVRLGGQEFAEAAFLLSTYLCDSVELIQKFISSNKKVLLEGAQAFGLDINHGKYPYVTSSDTTVAGLMSGSGINYKQIKKVIGVAKAIPSKVGGGPFVTAIKDEEIAAKARGEKGKVDSEFGATTGREREVGYLDLVALKRAVEVNGIDEIALTKFDCIGRHGKTTKIATAYEFKGREIKNPPGSGVELYECTPIYEELPTWQENNSTEARKYIKFIEDYLKVPVTMLGIGPNREDLVIRKKSNK